MYLPAAERFWHLMDDEAARARALVAWKRRLTQNWSSIRVEEVEADADTLQVGEVLQVRAKVHLGELTPEDVALELYHGAVDEKGEIPSGVSTTMQFQEEADGLYVFTGAISCRTSGLFGYALRVLPSHKDLINPHAMGLILWG